MITDIKKTIITGQSNAAAQLAPIIVQWKTQLAKRKNVWDKLSIEQKQKWLKNSQTKDELLWMTLQFYLYLDKILREVVDDYRE